uniref:Uncharacterized protein n=1 Tax=Micrurus lemniscatus lemniscatus TaxID=129467 RepID=A0A2D4IBP0_MICLE
MSISCLGRHGWRKKTMSPNSCAECEQSSCPEVFSVVLRLSPVELHVFCFDSLNTISRLFSSSWQLISAVNSILKLGNSPWNWEKQQKKAYNTCLLGQLLKSPGVKEEKHLFQCPL